ncbi:MAG: phosphoribosylformylglycinamidine synthase subunit PurL [Chthonomonadales bacterium]
MIAPDIYREMGLNDQEYAQILQILGREPSETELGMFAVMWSEHCGYKYSRPVLALFKTYREAQEQGALENAGVIPLDDKLGIVFKMESHNHPSAVEPFQGAATGVGGILRDIFTMGARPIANLNSLRFGPISDSPDATHNRYLFERVVEGIAHYGNCVGVPTVAGEVVFNPCYSGNPLVNAMAVGVVDLDNIASAKAEGIGNPVLYVGSATGKDGIHGATFASVELGPDSESKRPNVQMGDPFMEKLLIEATLEALATGDIVGIQDMGAAGLTCGTSETASKANTGMEIDVLKVPRRERKMSPYEIMLSESQERMLAICRIGREDRVAAVFKKWGLNAVVIGHVTGDGMVRVKEGDVVVAEIPAKALTDDCPVYHLTAEEPAYYKVVNSFDPSTLPEPTDYNETLARLLSTPTIASKEWVTEQYDSMVQTLTVAGAGMGDAAILRIRDTTKGIAVKTDGNSRYCYLDPYIGGMIAVAESARNVACVGARPSAVTDCLNFANPEKPTGFWQFKRAVEGIAKATEAFGTPVVSGNVSFYNETPEGAIHPTPTIGMLGILDDVNKRCGSAFREEGDVLVLLRADNDPSGGVGGSEYLALIHGIESGRPPSIDLDAEKRLQACLFVAINEGLLASAHDCSDGGLAVALAESAIDGDGGKGVGAAVLLRSEHHNKLRPSAIFFGEAQSRVVVSLRTERQLKTLEKLALDFGIRAEWIGSVGGDSLRITIDGRDLINSPIARLKSGFTDSIRKIMTTSAP